MHWWWRIQTTNSSVTISSISYYGIELCLSSINKEMWVEEILWKRKFNLQYVCGWEDRKLSENWKSFRGDTARNYFVCLHLCIHLLFVCCSWESNILFIDDMEPPDMPVTLKYLTDKVSKVQCEPSLLLILYPGRSPGAVVHYIHCVCYQD